MLPQYMSLSLTMYMYIIEEQFPLLASTAVIGMFVI
jgi:hypothetical protein